MTMLSAMVKPISKRNTLLKLKLMLIENEKMKKISENGSKNKLTKTE
jgi:hypothetical protein